MCTVQSVHTLHLNDQLGLYDQVSTEPLFEDQTFVRYRDRYLSSDQ